MYLLGLLTAFRLIITWGYILIACQDVSFCMAVVLGAWSHVLFCQALICQCDRDSIVSAGVFFPELLQFFKNHLLFVF